MKLSDELYNEIIALYSSTRREHSMELAERERKAYATLPVLSDYDAELSALRSKLFDALSKDKDTSDIESEMDRISQKKSKLIEHEFGSDYLKMTYTCNACKDTGYIGEEGHKTKCECFNRHASRLFYERYGNKSLNKNHTFDTFKLDIYDQEKDDSGISPYETADAVFYYLSSCYTRYLKDMDDSAIQYKNIYIYGPTGVGKTYLLECVFNEAVKNYRSAIYLTANDLFRICDRARFNRFDDEDEDDSVDSFYQSNLCDCDILLIDDLGTEPMSKFSRSDLFYYINTRLISGKSTIITGNYEPDELANIYDNRISSRIMGDYLTLTMIGEDLRTRIK